MDDKSVITSGGIEKIGLPDSFITVKLNGEKHKMERPIAEHTAGVQWIFEVLTTGDYAVLKNLEELDAVGHRMVHGGEKFNKSVRLTPEVMEAFAACNDLAPLHNPANIKGVNAVSALLPNIPQVGVFDTAFHQTMPDYAYMYALPYNLYKEYGVAGYALRPLVAAHSDWLQARTLQLASAAYLFLMAFPAYIHYLRNSYDDKISVRMQFYSLMLVQTVLALWLLLSPTSWHSLFPLLVLVSAPGIAHLFTFTRTWLTNAWFIFCLIMWAILCVLPGPL